MAYRRRVILGSSVCLFVGAVAEELIFILCTGDAICKVTPNVYSVPAWTSAMIILISLFGLYVCGKELEERWQGFLYFALMLVGLALAVVSTVFTSRVISLSGLWLAMTIVSLCLVVVIVVSFVCFFIRVKLQLSVGRKKPTVVYRKEPSVYINVGPGIDAGKPVETPGASTATIAQPGPSRRPEQTYSTRIASDDTPQTSHQPEPTYSTKIADDDPSPAPPQQSYYQPLIFENMEGRGASSSARSPGQTAGQGGAGGSAKKQPVAGRPMPAPGKEIVYESVK